MRNDHLDETNEARKNPGAASDAWMDEALKQALRAEDPGAAFTQRVLARAREERAAQQQPGRPSQFAAIEPIWAASSEVSALPTEAMATSTEVSPRRQRFTATRTLIAAIAASLTLTAVAAQWVQHRRYVAEGERARAQVLEALRLTNAKLNIVHDKLTEREHAR